MLSTSSVSRTLYAAFGQTERARVRIAVRGGVGVGVRVRASPADDGRVILRSMARARYPITPMTLGNMRSLGVRSLAVTCELCHHEAVLPADRWSDAVLVRSFRPRMVCTQCGIVGADARPNWREMQASGNWRMESSRTA
ncbi:MAG: hypothetical protein WBW73_29100 [Rhodoplanes sp.]